MQIIFENLFLVLKVLERLLFIGIKSLSCIISIEICKSLKVVEIKVLSFLGVKIHSKLNLKIRIKI